MKEKHLYISEDIRNRHPYRSLITAVLQRAIYDSYFDPPSYIKGIERQPPHKHIDALKSWAEMCPSLSRAQLTQILHANNESPTESETRAACTRIAGIS